MSNMGTDSKDLKKIGYIRNGIPTHFIAVSRRDRNRIGNVRRQINSVPLSEFTKR